MLCNPLFPHSPLYCRTLPLSTSDSGKTVTSVWTRPRDRIYRRVAAFLGREVLCWSAVRWKPAAVMTTHPDFCCGEHVHPMERQQQEYQYPTRDISIEKKSKAARKQHIVNVQPCLACCGVTLAPRVDIESMWKATSLLGWSHWLYMLRWAPATGRYACSGKRATGTEYSCGAARA